MRRSQAPSVLNKLNRFCKSNNAMEVEHTTDYEDEQYTWGSCNSKVKLNQNSRIFNVVWRDLSTRKHKNWKSDGTLEVSNDFPKAILKDESGKYIGCSTKFKRNDLVPDFQMVIGGKEIEIQNEIIGDDKLYELRKMQIENHNYAEEEYLSASDNIEEAKKTKAGYKFKPILELNPPKFNLEVMENLEKENCYLNSMDIDKVLKWGGGESKNKSKTKNRSILDIGICREYICFLRPSELQQFLFKKVMEYSYSVNSYLTIDKIKSYDIERALKLICNHPSFINHESSTNKLIRFLIPNLPDWAEMGPFDSAKLEFVQHFLNDLTKFNSQACVIFAENLNVLDMLQGLCDFMNINCLLLNINLVKDAEKQVNEFFSSKNESSKVLLVNSIETINNSNMFIYCKKLIFFEEVSKNIKICAVENVRDITVYNLITAFSIEELLLMDTYNNQNMGNLLNELVNVTKTENTSCFLHSKIECNCLETNYENVKSNNVFIKNWKHFKYPYDVELLMVSSLENFSENIVSIFCRKM